MTKKNNKHISHVEFMWPKGEAQSLKMSVKGEANRGKSKEKITMGEEKGSGDGGGPVVT